MVSVQPARQRVPVSGVRNRRFEVAVDGPRRIRVDSSGAQLQLIGAAIKQDRVHLAGRSRHNGWAALHHAGVPGAASEDDLAADHIDRHKSVRNRRRKQLRQLSWCVCAVVDAEPMDVAPLLIVGLEVANGVELRQSHTWQQVIGGQTHYFTFAQNNHQNLTNTHTHTQT